MFFGNLGSMYHLWSIVHFGQLGFLGVCRSGLRKEAQEARDGADFAGLLRNRYFFRLLHLFQIDVLRLPQRSVVIRQQQRQRQRQQQLYLALERQLFSPSYDEQSLLSKAS